MITNPASRHGPPPPAGLRNLLVHMYEQIDYRVVAASIAPALEDSGEVLAVFEKRLAAMEE